MPKGRGFARNQKKVQKRLKLEGNDNIERIDNLLESALDYLKDELDLALQSPGHFAEVARISNSLISIRRAFAKAQASSGAGGDEPADPKQGFFSQFS